MPDGTKKHFGLDLETLSFDHPDKEIELLGEQVGFRTLFEVDDQKLSRENKNEMRYTDCFGAERFFDFLTEIAKDNIDNTAVPEILKNPSNDKLVKGLANAEQGAKQRGAISVAKQAEAILSEHFGMEQAKKNEMKQDFKKNFDNEKGLVM